jgi:hypothetical protein
MAEESLQAEQNLAHQQREWLVERVGWIVMLLLILAAAAGLFGNGVLSRASVSDGKQMTIEYERFAHYLTPTSFKVHMRTTSKDKDIQLRINSDFLHGVKLEKVVPEPIRVETGDKWLSYHFPVNTAGEVTIKFDVTPETVGKLSAVITAASEAQLSFNQLIYP